MSYTLIIADDHTLVRQGIQALLERAGEAQVIGHADDGNQAVEMTLALQPDILMLDLSLPRLNGLEVLQRLTAAGSKTRVLVVTMHADDALALKALRSGARGYLHKSAFQDELFLALRATAAGEIYLSPPLAGRLLNDLLTAPPSTKQQDPVERLSSREREVFQLIVEGFTNRRIASALQISIKTVDKHRTNLMKKLGVHDVSGLMHVAVKHDLLYVR